MACGSHDILFLSSLMSCVLTLDDMALLGMAVSPFLNNMPWSWLCVCGWYHCMGYAFPMDVMTWFLFSCGCHEMGDTFPLDVMRHGLCVSSGCPDMENAFLLDIAWVMPFPSMS